MHGYSTTQYTSKITTKMAQFHWGRSVNSWIVLYCIVLYCGRVPAANAPRCTVAEGLLYKPWSLVVPTCTRDPSSERPTVLEREIADEFFLKMPDFHVTFTDLLHAVNLRHGTNGFTSLPKEGVLRIFSPWKSDGFGRVWTRELGYQRKFLNLLTLSWYLD